jgi:uncharacterized protein (TIGR02266 family)
MPEPPATSLVVEHPRELVERYYPNGKLGGITFDGEPPGSLGSAVKVTVRVKMPAREFSFEGILAWARHRAARQPASYGVEFTPADVASRARLLAFARAEVSPEAMRNERRLHVEWPVRVVHQGKAWKERLADLSLGGAFVRTQSPLRPGELVELSLRPPSSLLRLRVRGYVVWERQDGNLKGMGIEFVADSATKGRLARLLARLMKS